MKNKLWLIHLPVVLTFSFFFHITEQGIDGQLDNKFVREHFYRPLRNVSAWFLDQKFKIRGAQKPKNKIVVVAIDEYSLSQLGRWPWRRNVVAGLIDTIEENGAKAVALDIFFPEPEEAMPPTVKEILIAQNLGDLVKDFDTDAKLAEIFAKHNDRLVSGWAANGFCQPSYSSAEECPVADVEIRKLASEGYDRFSVQAFDAPKKFDFTKTPIPSVFIPLPNIDVLNNASKYTGHLFVDPDPDGTVRRTNLVLMYNGRPYTSLPFSMAAAVLGDRPYVKMDETLRISEIGFEKSGKRIPSTALGLMDVNFQGGRFTFPEASAAQVLLSEDQIEVLTAEKIEPVLMSKKDFLKDALVFIGSTALGAHDMRSFPYDSHAPGVLGHANTLENILSESSLETRKGAASPVFILLLMTLGALAYGYIVSRIESVPALALFLLTFSGSAFADGMLFSRNIHVNSAFFYIELISIFVFTLAVRYVLEERNKKFLRSSFEKYVSPDLIESIIKDPSKLSLGGEKRDLTILFSDIRSFTTFSEKMDAKALAGFLNDYLSIMTDIVFKHKGTLDKYIGDAVMAFWGAPVAQGEHAENACKAAMEMQQVLERERPRFKSQYGLDVNIGVGLNSGAVNVGNMGSSRVFEYTVIGDHVNLASRLEGLTKPYGAGILTTRFTFDSIVAAQGKHPPHRTLDMVKVKGKKKAVELIQILEKPLPAEGLQSFNKARELYLNRQWDDAIAEFRKALQLLSTGPDQPDEICNTYIERCEEFKKSPPDADWDGSWEMTSK